MPRANCRCGHSLSILPGGPDRIICPKCGARVRVRKRAGDEDDVTMRPGDGYLRFECSCGRRLKVSATERPTHGKCPDCGNIVPVPATAAAVRRPSARSESPTEDLLPTDLDELDKWSAEHDARAAGQNIPRRAPVAQPRAEVGMRLCPRCKKPVHMGATACRECGMLVPKKS